MLFRATATCLERLEDEIITSGSYNITFLRFEFSDEWAGMIKTATIRADRGMFRVLLDENNVAGIPQAALLDAGSIDVGVFGIRGTVIQPTVWVEDIRVWPGAYDPELIPNFQEPTLYEQLMSTMSDVMTKSVYDPRGLNMDLYEYMDMKANEAKPQVYSSLAAFPNQGRSDQIYLAENTNKLYRWLSDSLRYECIGSNYEEVSTISGGSA